MVDKQIGLTKPNQIEEDCDGHRILTIATTIDEKNRSKNLLKDNGHQDNLYWIDDNHNHQHYQFSSTLNLVNFLDYGQNIAKDIKILI